jgi:hypothetical protein
MAAILSKAWARACGIAGLASVVSALHASCCADHGVVLGATFL